MAVVLEQLHVVAVVLAQLHVVVAAALEQLRVVVAAVLAQLHVVVAAVLAQLHVVVAAVLAQLHVVVAVVLAQLHVVVAVVLAQLHVVVAAALVPLLVVVAAVLAQLHAVAALLVRRRALAALSECSPFGALSYAVLWYAVLSPSVCSLCGPCSRALAVSLRRLGSYVRLSLRRLFAWCYVLASSYVLEPWCGQPQCWNQLCSHLYRLPRLYPLHLCTERQPWSALRPHL